MSAPATLLPPNASALELALEAADAKGLAAVDADVLRALWDPAKCPEPWLGVLAAAYGTTPWDSGWPQGKRRAAIASAVADRRRHGTESALRGLLDFLGAQYNLDYKTGADIGKLTVEIFNSAELLSRVQAIPDMIDAVKRLSIHVTVQSSAGVRLRVQVGAGVAPAPRVVEWRLAVDAA